ncbi:nucleotidyltransferase [Gracilibacillus alcaliphilus]|uniref:nucleotidyltransferase n=1 Tax=Gracilibacillus alcaliphilus TaxID=1401441 RepID=UPI00195DA043|nr:nucleotidyltransferase [Gracilibacillus alcaliphilus]MBM7678636.1 putative nucleotidyltransferase [Gracilibacillus alcaliphilus]
MKACGLIVEYNPYHNGHRYHFQQAQQLTNADCMIAVMSGNFLQRGEPAVVDKFARAKMAVQLGIDLVVELPYFYAVQHSELFAQGAIEILAHLHVEALCFGSEHGKINDFQNMYQLIQQRQEQYGQQLTEALSKGFSYPKAHETALRAIGGKEISIDVTRPNNILGYQYVSNIYKQQADITPYTITRIKNDYHDQAIRDAIASATSIRNQLLQKQFEQVQSATPPETWQLLEKYVQQHHSWHHWEAYFHLLKYRLLTIKPDELRSIHGVKEGIENRMLASIKQAANFQEWMTLLKTKRYTWTSIQRIATHLLTNTHAAEIESLLRQADQTPAVRILAMSKQGQTYLKQIKKQATISWYTSNKSPYPYQALDQRVDAAYYSILDQTSQMQLAKQAYHKPYMIT